MKIRWLSCLAFALGLAFLAGSGHAAILSAELRVNGLSCPFCAFGIEKKLLDVAGVRDVEVFLDEGRVALGFVPNSEATVADLEEAVEKAGFEIVGLRVVVSGKLLAEGSDVRIVANPDLTFRLLEARGSSSGRVSAEMLERLRSAVAAGDRVLVIEGSVEDRGLTEPKLILESLRSNAAEAK